MPFIIFIACLLLSTPLIANDGLRVVTSIRPLQLITDEVMLGRGKSTLLIDSSQSPHHFSLKPSQLKLATKSHLLIWVSNDFESGLKRLQSVLPASNEQLQLATLLPEDQLIGDHHELDGHIWLSVQNIIAISRLIADKLSHLDATNKALYQRNSQSLIDRVTAWQQLTSQALLSNKPSYIVEHRFLSYFERSLRLAHSDSLRNTHDHGSSIKQLSAIHSKLRRSPVSCLLVSSLPLSRQAQQISQRYQLQTQRVDTLGVDSKLSSIVDLLDAIARTLGDCRS